MPKTRKIRQSRRPAQMRMASGPSQLRTNIENSHQFRYTSTGGGQKSITDSLVQTACGVSASTAILGYPIRQSVRVKRIEIWSPPASQGASVTCSVLFPSAQRSQAREYTDTSVSVAVPAHVVCEPPPESLCAFWTGVPTAGIPLFFITAPAGSIVDLWVGLVDNDANTVANTATLVGATIGGVYYCSLDSSTSAGSTLLPVGLTSA